MTTAPGGPDAAELAPGCASRRRLLAMGLRTAVGSTAVGGTAVLATGPAGASPVGLALPSTQLDVVGEHTLQRLGSR